MTFAVYPLAIYVPGIKNLNLYCLIHMYIVFQDVGLTVKYVWKL